MRAKVTKEIRKAMKSQDQDVTGAPQYFIAQTRKRMVYVMNEKGLPEGKIVDRVVIVNKTKNKYRKVKKMLKKQRQLGISAVL